jgi:hypothetical protein
MSFLLYLVKLLGAQPRIAFLHSNPIHHQLVEGSAVANHDLNQVSMMDTNMEQ